MLPQHYVCINTVWSLLPCPSPRGNGGSTHEMKTTSNASRAYRCWYCTSLSTVQKLALNISLVWSWFLRVEDSVYGNCSAFFTCPITNLVLINNMQWNYGCDIIWKSDFFNISMSVYLYHKGICHVQYLSSNSGLFNKSTA
jgi:hypothetical protein